MLAEARVKLPDVDLVEASMTSFDLGCRFDVVVCASSQQPLLGQMKQDGTLARLQEKWFGGTMETPDTIPSVLPS